MPIHPTDLEIRSEFAFLEIQLNILKIEILLNKKANFNPDQPRDACGRWCIQGSSHVEVIRKDRTGDPKIDAKTDLLIDIVKEVVEEVGAGSGPLYGVYIHTNSAQRIRDLNLPGIGKDGVEQSFSAGDLVRYGLNGSIRTDVILRDAEGTNGRVLAIWDFKTGNARLTEARAAEIRAATGVGKDVPIIEIHILRGINVKQIISTLYQNRRRALLNNP
ncbi:hypothetical protein [Methylobacterium segetis]|uniref:hypothetical protein n=1 Tax=Methylobacterium segetis TaxID=2488750 RepID=UPI001042E525|nr:hypothetical protein [Methylobacterium segetis]